MKQAAIRISNVSNRVTNLKFAETDRELQNLVVLPSLVVKAGYQTHESGKGS
jgi:hypothetical protein